MSIDLTNITHVVLQTGYSPSLLNLCEIEEHLREETESQLICLFAYSPSIDHIGVVIPSSTDFLVQPVSRPSFTGDLGTYHTQVSDLCHQLIAKKSDNPFYLDSLLHLNEQLALALEWSSSNPHPSGLYDNIIDSAIEWSLQPDVPIEAIEPMSYSDRIAETQRVFAAIGGSNEVMGSLCFKLDPENPTNPFKLMDRITHSPLKYCEVFEMTHLRCVKTDTMSILIITYDAEHG